MFSKTLPRNIWKRTLTISSRASADRCLERMRIAQETFYHYSQEHVDYLFEKVSDTVRKHSMELAKMAVEESGIGCVEDKTLKNIYATEHSVRMYKNAKTVGVLEHKDGVSKIAEPVGPICAILPCTNPTSTVIFKSLYALKTRNCIAFLPHPRSQACSIYTADLIHRCAVDAGAPEDWVVSCAPSREMSDYVMRHKEIKFLLATGGTDMVRACYAVGKPAIGVGSGNTPVVVDGTYDLRETVHSIMIGKTFDWGVPCITEQSVIVLDCVYDMVKDLLRERGVYFLTGDETRQLERVFFANGRVNPDIVGKSPHFIAQMAGIEIPMWALTLGVEASGIGDQEVFSHEKMSPILALYRASQFEDAVEMARGLVLFGGPGHSACLYTQQENRVQLFQNRVPAYHININMPALGGIGIRYNPHVAPSMTVGCGVRGGSMSSVNVGPMELIQVKTVARKITPPLPYHPPIVMRDDTLLGALRSLSLKKGDAVVLSDRPVPNDFMNFLRASGHNLIVLSTMTPDTEWIEKTLPVLDEFGPDLLFVLGGKEMMDTAKLLRLRYENRSISLDKLGAPFLEETSHFPDLKKDLLFVAIPDVPGSAESSPFTQYLTHNKVNTTFYIPSLTPDIIIYDPTGKDEKDVLREGFSLLLQGIEAFVSAHSTDETRQLLTDPIRQILFQLEGEQCVETIFQSGTTLSWVIAKNGVGLGSSMAAKMGSLFGVPFGHILAAATPHVMKFNASSCPTRGVASPHYPYPMAKTHYQALATSLGLKDPAQLVAVLQNIRWKMGIQATHSIIPRDSFVNHLHELSETTFGDSLHRTNPRMALLPDLHKLYKEIYFE